MNANLKYKHLAEKWKEDYKNGLSFRKISKIYNVDRETVSITLKSIGVFCGKKSKYEKETKDWIGLYNDGLSQKDIALVYDVNISVVRRQLEGKVKKKTKSVFKRMYSLNQDVFEFIDSKEKAYWLGVIQSDGNIYKDGNRYKISICFNEKDAYHLKRFNNFIQSNRPIRFIKNDNTARVFINSEKMYKDLQNFGVEPNKSLKIPFPENLIKKEYLKSFILGYFDGDGSICIDKKGQGIFGIVGNIEFLDRLQDLMVEEISILNKIKIPNRRGTKVYELRYKGNNQMRAIYDWLYSKEDVFLFRKKDKFEELLL